MKLLSPVQNEKSLNAALCNGADEIYLGINGFNARNNADGFTLETLKSAVIKAHLSGVKVNLAINVLFGDEEMQAALSTLIEAYNAGVDAFIVQDLGLAGLAHEFYPQIPLHASTQMGIHNYEGVAALKKYGFKRVVLARETPIEEIKRIKENSDVEIEYFAHGALCVSFSGNCYLSEKLTGASGNRGRCKQLCRLPYTLLKNDRPVKKGYLLSAKDFRTIDKLETLKEAGVDVLKIEGRMRRPFYTAAVTNAYRRALDGLDYDENELKLAFNRGYTFGYFEGNSNIISYKQNHVGIEIGKVIKVNGGKRFNEVFFTSDRHIAPQSTIKVFNQKGQEKCALSAYDVVKTDKTVYRLTTTLKIEVGDKFNLIADAEKEKIAENLKAKANVKISLDFTEGKPLSAKIEFNGENKIFFGETLQKAVNAPLTKKEVEECFSKSEFFCPKTEFKNFDKVFLRKKTLNDFRRTIYENLLDRERNRYSRNLKTVNLKIPERCSEFTDFLFTDDENAIYNKTNVIFSPEIYEEKSVATFIKNCEKQGKTPYLDAPNFVAEQDYLLIKNIAEKTGIKIVANNYYALSLKNVAVLGGAMNVYNSFAAKELGLPYIKAENRKDGQTVFPLMTFRHCPVKEHFGGSCANCLYDKTFSLKAENGRTFRLRRKKLGSCTFYLEE